MVLASKNGNGKISNHQVQVLENQIESQNLYPDHPRDIPIQNIASSRNNVNGGENCCDNCSRK